MSKPIDSKPNWSLFAGAESIGPTHSTPTTSSEDISTLSDSSSSSSNQENQHLNSRKGDPWKPKMIGISQDPNDWLWLMSEEPHKSRRKAILKSHPEVTKLMGHTTTTKWITLFVVGLQISISIYFSYLSNSNQQSAWNWRFFLTAYLIGGTANQNLFLSIHEITHNLAFKSIFNNKCLALFANLPITIPYSMIFKKYHLEHHRYLGEDGIDTDLPTKFELLCLNNVFGKTFFATFQILFYALRPGFVKSQKPTKWVFANFALQLTFNYFLYRTFGLTSLMYLLLSSFFAGSLHPCAAHFIAEHYLWSEGGEQETWSYYGPLNLLTYNVGYHNEHHDFPSIPWIRLPKLHQIAHEFYDPLPFHSSWPLVTFNFIFKTDVGLFSRVKRLPHPNHFKTQ
ncbi:fatty acid desaturase-domain-containing protein [Melampsora americana]|nr:fatty acid desaturase-domain-containing protein [Melampsora americana]